MARDALDLLDVIGWKRSVHLCGLSMGGMITQEIAKADPSRFDSMTLLSTISGGLTSLGLFFLKIPTGIHKITRTFLASDPRERLSRGMQILYPEDALNDTIFNPTTMETETRGNALRRTLMERGRQALRDGTRPLRLSTIIKQAVAVMTHRLGDRDLRYLSDHFGDAILIVTGDKDILVHGHNSVVLYNGMRPATLLIVPGAGHGANEQCPNIVNRAIEANIRRGMRRQGASTSTRSPSPLLSSRL